MLLKEHYGIFEMMDIIPTDWIDTAWHNDAMYSFEKGDVRIWIDVEVENIQMSELFYDQNPSEFVRFHVSVSDDYRDNNPDDHNNDSWLFEDNNFINIIKFVEENH